VNKDRRLWRTARTLEDLGNLTAQWLEGTITYLPAYYGDSPEEETTPLIVTLAAANRAGYVTDQSQPGQPLTDGNGQRAFVTGYCPETMVDRIRDAVLATDLVAIYNPPGWTSPVRIPVTIDDGAEFTWIGDPIDAENIRHHYSDDCPDAVGALLDAWQVAVFDPVWGRNDLLWDRLDTVRRS
jgi:hypothetical protein